jgi:hypothetical protein
MSRIRSRATFANVVSVIALFVALSSSATAAMLITGKNVKNGSLTGADVKNNSLGSGDVKDRSLLAKDFKLGQLPAGPQGRQGPPGATGATGATGPPGANGTNGATNVVVRTATGSDAYQGYAYCQPGERATGGGVTPNAGGATYVFQSRPAQHSGTPTGWYAYMSGGTGVTIYVVCASP